MNKIWKDKEAVSPVIGVILMVAITVVLAAVLYVWVSGFMGGAGGGAKTIALSRTGNNDTANTTTFLVDSTSAGGVLFGDITWLLIATDGTTTDRTSYTAHSTDLDSDGYLDAGDTITVTAAADGDFKLRAVYADTSIYESSSYSY